MTSALKDSLASLFSRVFPAKQNITVNVSASPEGDVVYVDAKLVHKGHSHSLSDLKNLPARVKFGARYVRVSPRNRHTLRQLADWDPVYDPRRGFVFNEKEVPDLLSYLRSKATVEFAESAARVRVDNRPLEYVHDIREANAGVEIKTALSDSDSSVVIEGPNQARVVEGSKYIHYRSAYLHKPPEKKYQTFVPEVGTTTLQNDQIPLFLLYDLARLRAETRARVAPEIEQQKVITSSFEPKVSLSIDGPWISFDVRYEEDRFKIPYERIERVDAAQQFVKEDDTWIRMDRPTHSRVSKQLAQIPELERVKGQFRTPSRNFYEVQSLLEQVAKIDVSEAYRRFLASIEDFSQIEEQELPGSLRGDGLRPYQRHGYDWLCFLRKYGLNGILADEMGLGKTVQTLTALLEAHSLPGSRTSLIVCPPSVLSAWEDDCKRFTSPIDFRTTRYVGANRKSVLVNLDSYDAILTTYAIVGRDIEALSNIAWEYIVLDEAHKIKNHETATAKSCKRLVAKHKLAVTGTPIENRLSELWSIYDFLMPSYLGKQSQFREKYEIPIMKHSDKRASAELKGRIDPFKLRRLKSDVAKDLPPKILMDRQCELTPEQAQLYKRFALEEQNRIRNLPETKVKIDISILTAILRLKQICCHPALITGDTERIYDRSGKLDAFVEILEELVEGGEKALIFSQFTRMLVLLRRVLDDRQLKYFYLDGTTPEKTRTQMKHEFQKGTVPFFLISLLAGGHGMTLTEANCVVHYDSWWNPAVEDQATDRVHRIGQDKPVKVFRIHTPGTIEDRIAELVEKKRNLFDSVIEVDDLRKEVSKDQLLALFAPPN
ncbi:MAG TPA: DEAD/DEAH box helicase [Candidatus Acidoferrales bacterium]|nr:DEAD/DEAH box helicase [Candidatus Acidoferrales bacterium]